MNKTRSDAKWLMLNQKQLAALEEWLFTEQISLTQALTRAKKQFGFTGSWSDLQRFYHRTQHTRQLTQFKEILLDARDVVKAGGREEQLCEAGMKFISQQFFQQAREKVDADLPVLAKMLLQNEANRLRRENLELRRESLELRREKMQLEEKHWEFDALEAAKAASPLLQQVLNRLEKEKPTPTYKERIRAIRIRLFGSAPERIAPLPEEPVAAPAATNEIMTPDFPPAPSPAPNPTHMPERPANPILFPNPAPTPNLPPPEPESVIPAIAEPAPTKPPVAPVPELPRERLPSKYECGIEIKKGRVIMYG